MVLYRNITIIASHLLYSSLQIEKPVSHNLLCTNLTRALVDIKLEAWGFLSVFHCIIQTWDLLSLKPLESKPKCPMTTRPPLLVVIMRNNERLFWMFTLRMKNERLVCLLGLTQRSIYFAWLGPLFGQQNSPQSKSPINSYNILMRAIIIFIYSLLIIVSMINKMTYAIDFGSYCSIWRQCI